ncbi:protein ROOT INITIATION DEFECTIVE 3 isoform X2 [Amborella trichopoda]|uniref:Uncharacterized protein n=2 Tax=Amborella trichopoda TaxID=13333 RepID=W1NDN8_AMBTC|nr:protein ROOT INITIATION DEFECTIVE 3 isoform X2 [Amborella trichopoda]XP_020517911.1 protein ROOT INITIATION DEFECTIVE 3 isoform X2 [Amborella trichopoda]ERM93812.1 hypothetical protein AMTR_s00138p00023960 [Amborella trichopoda]|eukprot:XP_006826575.1 protein ROOT INITIATION DEFECTIVE 3 isoform X2 [Amborella trichopoda]
MESSREVVVVTSPLDSGISSFELGSGSEGLRLRSCTAHRHGLTCLGTHFLASSQIQNSNSGAIFYWSWNKPQPVIKSFPVEPIKPLASNADGTYIVGGGSSGTIYLWEVASGKMIRKWSAHFRAVTCLVFACDESLLISGAEDGMVMVWSLLKILDDAGSSVHREHSFSGHSLPITDIVCGFGGCNSTIVSSSEDYTCKVWSLLTGLLRTVKFPSVINSVQLDAGEYALYAGSRDGKIYVADLNSGHSSHSIYGADIVCALSDHSKAVTSLAFSMDGFSLVSGSEDGTVRVWDVVSSQCIRIFKHGKGPINNVLIVQLRTSLSDPSLARMSNSILGKNRFSLPSPLEKYLSKRDENPDGSINVGPVVALRSNPFHSLDGQSFNSLTVLLNQIKELQQQGSSATSQMELERLKSDLGRAMQMVQRWQDVYQDLYSFSTAELLSNVDMTGVE